MQCLTADTPLTGSPLRNRVVTISSRPRSHTVLLLLKASIPHSKELTELLRRNRTEPLPTSHPTAHLHRPNLTERRPPDSPMVLRPPSSMAPLLLSRTAPLTLTVNIHHTKEDTELPRRQGSTALLLPSMATAKLPRNNINNTLSTTPLHLRHSGTALRRLSHGTETRTRTP